MNIGLKTLLAALGILLVPLVMHADDLGAICQQFSSSENSCQNLTADQCRTQLQQCAAYYDQQSAQIAKDITKTTQQKSALQGTISSLQKKIGGLQTQINQGTLMVKDLNVQIQDTQSSIDKTTSKIQESQGQIAGILQSIYQEDQKPSFVVLLQGNLSDFFSNLAYLESLNGKVSTLLESTTNLQAYLQVQQDKMSNQADALQKTIALQNLQKQQTQQNKSQQEVTLKLTEAQYQQQVQNKKAADAAAAKIRAQLFQIIGVPSAPTFGAALQVAQGAAQVVGVRPAFLLAIISQESAIGKNVGQCVLTNDSTGDGKKASSGAAAIRVMKPNRDVQPFLAITAALGRDPHATPVSCWIPAYVSGAPTGWGGAMGPAQFIASTWNLFTDRLNSLLGKAPDPWAIKDSFTAAGLYLSDLGAGAQTTAAERSAASRYYGGSSSYASSVLNRAACIQTFIDNGTMSSSCEALIF